MRQILSIPIPIAANHLPIHELRRPPFPPLHPGDLGGLCRPAHYLVSLELATHMH